MPQKRKSSDTVRYLKSSEEGENMPAIRIDVQEAFREITTGEAILVCAYEEEEKYPEYRLEKSMSFSEFLKKLPELKQDQEIIFYCG